MLIMVTGSMPPPIGGVTNYIKYFYEASLKSSSVNIVFFSIKYIFKFNQYILHINASNSLKRCLFVILGKLFFKKVVIVKHGGVFNMKSIFNKISLKLVDGVFTLNSSVSAQMKKYKIKHFQQTTILNENIKAIKDEYSQKKRKKNKVFTALCYINNSHIINGTEIYGASFISNCISKLGDDFSFIIIDLSADYKSNFSVLSNVIYYDRPLDFKNTLFNCDLYLRPTSTDGMSVAILESAILNIPCLASDVVDRPDYVYTYEYGSESDFINKIKNIKDKNESLIELNFTKFNELVSFINLL